MSHITFAISASDKPDDLARLRRSLAAQEGATQIEVLARGPVAAAQVSTMRNELFCQAKSPYVYFLDADCELPDPGFLHRLVTHLEAQPESALGGLYLPAPDAGILQRAYNSAANLWLKVHQTSDQALPVAGNFIVPKFKYLAKARPFPVNAAFGGEEVGLAGEFKVQDIPFQLIDDLSVIHHGAPAWTGFLGRARLHGSSPRQKLQGGQMIRPVLRHLRSEEPRVGLVVVLYLMVMAGSRCLGGLKWARG